MNKMTAGLVSLSMALGACTGSLSTQDQGGQTVGRVTSASVTTLIGAAPTPMTEAAVDTMIAAALADLTTDNLKAFNVFAGERLHSAGGWDDTLNIFATGIEYLYWAAPRDIVSSPVGGFAGQSFTYSGMIDPNGGTIYPLNLTVAGVAKADYVLSFTVCEVPLKAEVKAGMTATNVASLVADTINAQNPRDGNENNPITAGFGGSEDAIGGVSGALGGFDDYEVGAFEDGVSFTIPINS